MHHLVAPITNRSIPEALKLLSTAHGYLVDRAANTIASLGHVPPHRWGIQVKRSSVALGGTRPILVTKASERFAEVLNIVATLERLIDALRWFQAHPSFSTLWVLECHPSTSHTPGANDLVLGELSGAVRVRCEVSDVVAKNAHQNNKERLDLRALGVEGAPPDDGASRFLVVSSEFADALAQRRRAWHRLPYRYVRHLADFEHATMILEVVPAAAPPA